MRRIKTIEVANFKSLVDFKIDLAKFTCLIGMNAAGKSTVLQLIDFLSQLVHGNMQGWLAERKWKSNELKSKLSRKSNIEFTIRFADEKGDSAGRWEGNYNPTRHRCTDERFDVGGFTLRSGRDQLSIANTTSNTLKEYDVAFSYEGSILSALKEEILPPPILEIKRIFRGIKSLELLAPEHLRQRTRESQGTLGLGGQNLSAYLHEMPSGKRQNVFERLQQIYPQLTELHVKSLRSGWKQLEIAETYEDGEPGLLSPTMTTEARHINDGMLRIIAILAELQSDNQFLLFDEIENGINPEIVEFVLDLLVTSPKQILVTTHSPMILNYLEDDIAREGVIYLYKTRRGHTKAIPFFSIPSVSEKLTMMGPGEAFADTNLTELGAEIESATNAG